MMRFIALLFSLLSLLALAAPILAQTQSRIAELQAEVLELDRQIDARVADIVQMLQSVQDSAASGTEVMQIKKEAIEALEKWIQAYAQERGRRLGQIQGSGSAAKRTQLQGEVAAIDAEMDTRVDQIVALAASMNTREETERYDTYYADFGVAKVERDDYRANQRQIARADQTQEEVAQGLEQAIAGIERDIALVPQRLPRDQQSAELDRLNQLLAERRTDLQALSNASSEEKRNLGDREADQLERELLTARQEVRALWTQLLAKANLLAAERQRVRPRPTPPPPAPAGIP